MTNIREENDSFKEFVYLYDDDKKERVRELEKLKAHEK